MKVTHLTYIYSDTITVRQSVQLKTISCKGTLQNSLKAAWFLWLETFPSDVKRSHFHGFSSLATP